MAAQGMNAEIPVDVTVKKDYAGAASTLYSDIFTWLTDGMPDTEQQKKDVAEKVQAYYDELLSEINLQESTERAKLQEQLDNGFITYETFHTRTAELLASSAAARTSIGTLCDESLSFVQNYAGQPASVVQEAYAEIDSLEQRTEELLKQIGLVNAALGERGANAAALTKAGATGDVETFDLAFEHTNQQFALDKAQIESEAASAVAEAERIWKDAYTAAQQSGDQAGMDLANKRYEELTAQIDAGRKEKLAELEMAYVGEFEAMFEGIAKRFPEQAAALKEAMAQIELSGEAQALLSKAFSGGLLTADDLSEEMIKALSLEGVDVSKLVEKAGGDAEKLSANLYDALAMIVKQGDGLDLESLLTEGLAGTELGAAFGRMLEAGYLSGIESVDLNSLDAQLALLTGHVDAYLGTGVDGAAAGGTWVSDIVTGITEKLSDVSSAAKAVGDAGKSGISSSMNASAGKGLAKHIGDGLVQGLYAQVPRVRIAAKALGNAALGGTSDSLQVRSPSRKFRWMANMVGDGFVLGLEDKEDLVRSTMQRIVSLPEANLPQVSGAAVASADGDSQGYGSTTYNIKVEGARINSIDEARELLKQAAKYTNSVNKGRGRW